VATQGLRIKDVARHAGVSPATVSRVMNETATVGPVKRALVMAAIEELGYRPNRLASNFRRRQAEMIGVVVSDIENPHFTQMVRAVEDASYLRGHRVLLCNTDEDPAKQRDYLGVLAAERVAGVILSPTDGRAAEISELLDHGISLVAFDRRVSDRRADVVVAQNAAGARTGTEHLLECGHQRVGFVGGPGGVQTADERRSGYLQAIAAAGSEPIVADGGFRAERGRAATGELVDRGITALLIANNLMAIGALQAIRERQLRIPEDIALVSIDDPPWAELTDPPLTTLSQPIRQMAEAAVGLLLERIEEGRTRRKTRLFDLQLHHRGSCCNGELRR
jgi:DNA-binding LacI/PurR family transcriptional regulator